MPVDLRPMSQEELVAIQVRKTLLVNINHPEWGTWGVMDDLGDLFVILGDRGSRVLNKSEALKEWAVVVVAIPELPALSD